MGMGRKSISAEIFVNEESARRREKLTGSLDHSLREYSVLYNKLYNVILRVGEYY